MLNPQLPNAPQTKFTRHVDLQTRQPAKTSVYLYLIIPSLLHNNVSLSTLILSDVAVYAFDNAAFLDLRLVIKVFFFLLSRNEDHFMNVTTEGCFCPDGTRLFSKESGLCVEKCGKSLHPDCISRKTETLTRT